MKKYHQPTLKKKEVGNENLYSTRRRTYLEFVSGTQSGAEIGRRVEKIHYTVAQHMQKIQDTYSIQDTRYHHHEML